MLSLPLPVFIMTILISCFIGSLIKRFFLFFLVLSLFFFILASHPSFPELSPVVTFSKNLLEPYYFKMKHYLGSISIGKIDVNSIGYKRGIWNEY